MAAFGMAALCTFTILALLPCGSIGSTLYGESHTMRREPKAATVQLSAHGDIATKKKASVADFCDFDFPLGFPDTNDCASANHSLIFQENLCIQAATAHSATTASAHFMVPTDWEDGLPKGCFKYKCTESSSGTCYFFNEKDDILPNATVKGTPVCSRPKYVTGKKNTNGGCPPAYKVLDDEDACGAAGVCLGDGKGDHFIKGLDDLGNHLKFPHGCFSDNDDRKAYFNPSTPNSDKLGPGKDGMVQGTPICVVKEVNPEAPPKPPPMAANATAARAGKGAGAPADKKADAPAAPATM